VCEALGSAVHQQRVARVRPRPTIGPVAEFIDGIVVDVRCSYSRCRLTWFEPRFADHDCPLRLKSLQLFPGRREQREREAAIERFCRKSPRVWQSPNAAGGRVKRNMSQPPARVAVRDQCQNERVALSEHLALTASKGSPNLASGLPTYFFSD
jgi:hypothetical protein